MIHFKSGIVLKCLSHGVFRGKTVDLQVRKSLLLFEIVYKLLKLLWAVVAAEALVQPIGNLPFDGESFVDADKRLQSEIFR